MTVTEFGVDVIKAGIDLHDVNSEGYKVLHKAHSAIISQPTGPYRIYWGTEVENPNNLWEFFDFASVEEHAKFAEDFGKDIVKDHDKFLERGVFSKHLDLKPHPLTALRSPVTEVLLAYFHSDLSPELREANTKKLDQFSEKARNSGAGIQAVNWGWGLEKDFPVLGGEEGDKASVAAWLAGWPSVDAHMKFRDTDEFKEAIPLIRSLEGLKKMKMFHVKVQILENETRKEE